MVLEESRKLNNSFLIWLKKKKRIESDHAGSYLWIYEGTINLKSWIVSMNQNSDISEIKVLVMRKDSSKCHTIAETHSVISSK